jgi:hypothetical protein
LAEEDEAGFGVATVEENSGEPSVEKNLGHDEDEIRNDPGTEKKKSQPDMKRGRELELLESEPQEKMDAKDQKKSRSNQHWCSLFLVQQKFDYSKLSPVARATVDKMSDYPDYMWFCPLGDFTTGTAPHQAYLLLDPDRPFKTNVVDHFNVHKRIKDHMETARSQGLDLERAKEQILNLLNSEKQKVGSATQVTLFQLPRLNKAEKVHLGLLDREKKEIALAAFLIDTHTPLFRLQKQSWLDLCSALQLELHKPEALRRVHYPLIFEAILRIRRSLFTRAGFIHTEFDFLSFSSSKYLIICGRTVVDFVLFSDVIGLIEWCDTASAPMVAALARSTIDRVAPDSVQLCSNTVDGALLAASEELVPEDDSWWCFCHQLALPIKKSLTGIIGEDFAFMHRFGVYLRSHAGSQEKLDRIRKMRLGEGSELKMLTDSLARWTSEWRKLKRFMDLQSDLISLSKDSSIAALLREWQHDKQAPKDVFKPKFWARLQALFPIFSTLHSVVKQSQASNIVVMSSIPWWLRQIDTCLRMNVEDEPSEVGVWKAGLLHLLDEQFNHIRNEVNLMWLATALDPRFANLSFFGVSADMEKSIWDQVLSEHVSLKERRMNATLIESKRKLAASCIDAVRNALKDQSVQFLEKIESKNSLDQQLEMKRMEPLTWWQQMTVKGTVDHDFMEFAEVSKTACMLLSTPGTSAFSERSVGRFRSVMTPFRAMLSEGMLEQEIVASHFISTSQYSFKKLIEQVQNLQEELKQKKEKETKK